MFEVILIISLIFNLCLSITLYKLNLTSTPSKKVLIKRKVDEKFRDILQQRNEFPFTTIFDFKIKNSDYIKALENKFIEKGYVVTIFTDPNLENYFYFRVS